MPPPFPATPFDSFSTPESPLHSDFSIIPTGQRLALAAILIAILGAGCQSAHVPNSVVTKFPSSDTDAQLSFWHELAERHLTSNDDAFHGLLLYLDGKDD